MISLYDMLEAADGQLFGEAPIQLFTDLAIDLAGVVEGCLYIALRTAQGDGHHHIRAAVEKGAVGLVCTQPPDFDTSALTVMIVRDAEQALMNWAEIIMMRFAPTVIGVVGATGQATTMRAISAVLETHYDVYYRPNGLLRPDARNGRLSLPLALGKLTADHQLVLLELDATNPDDMAALVEIAQPLVAVVTDLGDATGRFTEQYTRCFAAIQTLCQSLPEDGLAVLNFDDEALRTLGSEISAGVFSVGIDSFEADMLAYNIVVGRHKTGFDLRYGSERSVGHWLPLLGRQQVYAAMLASALGLSYQIPLEDGLRALTQLEPMPGRLRPLAGRNGSLLVDDTLESYLQSAQFSLEWLAAVRAEDSRLIVVLGELENVDNYARRIYRQLGERLAGVVDILVTQGNLVSIVGQAALDYGLARRQLIMTHGRHDTLAALDDLIGPKDIVLVKGLRSAGMGEVVQRLLAEPEDEILLGNLAVDDAGEGLESHIYASWLEIDTAAVAHNVSTVLEMLGQTEADAPALLALVPADAYGHGAVAVGATALHNGAVYLGVDTFEEAVALRDGGIDAPILVMGYVPPYAVRDAIRFDLTLTVTNIETARLLQRSAAEMRRTVKIHIKIDTGLGWWGVPTSEVMTFFRGLRKLDAIEVEGVFTELAAADVDRTYTLDQLAIFAEHVSALRASGMTIPYAHAANSVALLSAPANQYTMVRSGALLLGVSPSAYLDLPEAFHPVLSWKTVIAQVNHMPRGRYVGPHLTYRTAQDERLAVLPVGYADGFRSAPYISREVLVHGERIPVVGRVGRRATTIDVTAVPEAKTGDEVVLIGTQGANQITAEEVAHWLNCSVQEVLSTIMPRDKRL